MSGSTVTVTLDELQKMIRGVGDKFPEIAERAMTASVQAMVRDVVANRMTGQYLGVVTGTARRSITGRVKRGASSITASIGSTLKYVRAHEMGYTGPVQVRAHQRRLVELSSGRGGKITKASARKYKKAKAAGRKTMSHVRAHTRRVNIRARRFLRDTVMQEAGTLPAMLLSGEPAFSRRLVRAMQIYVEQGRMPSVGDLGLGG